MWREKNHTFFSLVLNRKTCNKQHFQKVSIINSCIWNQHQSCFYIIYHKMTNRTVSPDMLFHMEWINQVQTHNHNRTFIFENLWPMVISVNETSDNQDPKGLFRCCRQGGKAWLNLLSEMSVHWFSTADVTSSQNDYWYHCRNSLACSFMYICLFVWFGYTTSIIHFGQQ